MFFLQVRRQDADKDELFCPCAIRVSWTASRWMPSLFLIGEIKLKGAEEFDTLPIVSPKHSNGIVILCLYRRCNYVYIKYMYEL